MADKKWSEFPAVTTFNDTDLCSVVRPGDPSSTANKKITGLNFKNTVAGELYVSNNFYNGIVVETIETTVIESGGNVYLTLQQAGTGDLTIQFGNTRYIFDCTPAAQIQLTAGSDISPTTNYTYIIENSGSPILQVSTTGWPAIEYAAVAISVVQSPTGVANDKVYMHWDWTDHIYDVNEQGALTHLQKKFRQQNADWRSGVAPTLTITPQGAAPDDLIFTSTSGIVYRLHEDNFPAFIGIPDLFVTNDSTTPYNKIDDLNVLLTDSEGNSMADKRFSLVIWGAISENTGDCKLFVNLPSSTYTKNDDAIADIFKHSNYNIPSDFKGVGFLIARYTLRHQSLASGTWTLLDTDDLRGQYPANIAGGGGISATTEFSDNQFKIYNVADSTKELVFDLSGIPTGTARTLTVKADATIDQDLQQSSQPTFAQVTLSTEPDVDTEAATKKYVDDHPGTNLLEQSNVFYAATAGNDGNAGKNVAYPFLTDTAAITAANTPAATETTQIKVELLDGAPFGIFNLNVKPWINIDAPTSFISGLNGSVIGDNNIINIGTSKLSSGTGTTIGKLGAGQSFFSANKLYHTTGGLTPRLLNVSAGVLFSKIDYFKSQVLTDEAIKVSVGNLYDISQKIYGKITIVNSQFANIITNEHQGDIDVEANAGLGMAITCAWTGALTAGANSNVKMIVGQRTGGPDSIEATANVNIFDISKWNDNLTLLTTEEITQLTTIGETTTISAAQWQIVGSMNQYLSSTNSVAFNKLTATINADVALQLTATTATFTTISVDTSRYFGFNTGTALLSSNLSITQYINNKAGSTTGTFTVETGVTTPDVILRGWNSGKWAFNQIVAEPDGQVYINQPVTDAAIPVLELNQADNSEGVINFIANNTGVIAGATDSIASCKVELNGTVVRLALYSSPA